MVRFQHMVVLVYWCFCVLSCLCFDMSAYGRVGVLICQHMVVLVYWCVCIVVSVYWYVSIWSCWCFDMSKYCRILYWCVSRVSHFVSYFFSLRSKTKRNRNCFASFAKRTKLVFASFRFNFFAFLFVIKLSTSFRFVFLIFRIIVSFSFVNQIYTGVNGEWL